VRALSAGRAAFAARPPLRRYTDPVAAIGGLVVLAGIPLTLLDRHRFGVALTVLAVLTVVGELPALLPHLRQSKIAIGTSTAFVFAMLVCFGLGPALLVQTAVSVMGDTIQRKQWWRTAFNVGMHGICLVASRAVLAIGGVPVLGLPHGGWVTLTSDLLPAVLASAVTYFVVNHALISVAYALRDGKAVLVSAREHLDMRILGDAALLTLSPAVVVCLQRSPTFVPLFLVPLIAVYKSAAVSMEREHEAFHDALTGLPNRQLLVEHIEQAIGESGRSGRSIALFLLDLDRFKEVNDTLGHSAGDRLLQLVSARLEGALRPGDIVARLGGDEFAVLLPTVRDAASAMEVAERTRAALVEPFRIDGFVVGPEASIGVALIPDHAADAATLMQRADVAMYLAKASRRGVEVYAADRDRNSANRLGLLSELRTALEQGQLELHYQPKAQLPDGVVNGVEALVRWHHPERGMIPPDEFIPLAEQSGLMPKLTRYVLEHALAQVSTWTLQGLTVQVAVNVSMRDLHDDTFVEFLGGRLAAYAVPGNRLVLEITEGTLMADADRVATMLAELNELGVSISLDDFGTGYSSLVHLRRLPVSEIKIDRSFVMRMDTDVDDATIVRSIVELGDALGLRVVAEGVETESAWLALSRMGCDFAQGWYLSKALPAAEATAWLRDVGRARPVLAIVDNA
jgi:diguanylate cyclase (GGDEF)-like protein